MTCACRSSSTARVHATPTWAQAPSTSRSSEPSPRTIRTAVHGAAATIGPCPTQGPFFMIADKTYEPVQPLRLAFLGLVTMGGPMAAHLLKAGHHVTVYNRTQAKAEAWLAEVGQNPRAGVAATPLEAAASADIVLSCVGNDQDLTEVTTGPQGSFHSMAAGTL